VIHFEVVNGGVVRIQNLMNYPNPFSDKTHFVFEHNHPAENLKVQINIYSTAGRLVRTINENFTPDGSRSNVITWDATDNNGAKLPAGVYVYKLTLPT
jgi:flagellar hook assembly protein FlgD